MKDPFTNLIPGQLYSRSDIMEIIKEKGLTPPNPPAFTYNRWNKGMDKPKTYFEYVGRSQYLYLGVIKYTGPVFNDQKGGLERQIAQWNDGGYKFLDPKIKNFKQWKESDFEGFPSISEGCKIRLTINGKESHCILRQEDMKDGYNTISPDSPLGKQLLGKKVGDKFSLGPSNFEVLEIS